MNETQNTVHLLTNSSRVENSQLDSRIEKEINSILEDITSLFEKFSQSLKYEEEVENSIIKLNKRTLVMINIINDRSKVPYELALVITSLIEISKIYDIDINEKFTQFSLVQCKDGFKYPKYATFRGHVFIDGLINVTNNIIADKLYINKAIK